MPFQKRSALANRSVLNAKMTVFKETNILFFDHFFQFGK